MIRITLITFICCLLMVSLSACQETEQKVPVQEIRVRVQTLLLNDNGIQEIADHFNAIHPEIKIVIEQAQATEQMKLAEQLRSDSPPDLIYINFDYQNPLNFLTSVEEGLLLDLDQFVNANETTIPQELLVGGRLNSQQYLVPVAIYPSVMFYNQNLFDRAELPMPEEGWTWGQFDSYSRQIDRISPEVYGSLVTSSFIYTQFVWLVRDSGYDIQSADGKYVGYLDSPEAVLVAQWLYGYSTQSKARNLSDAEQPSFDEGLIGMKEEEMSSTTPEIIKKLNEPPSAVKLGVAPWPQFDGAIKSNPARFGYYGISSKSKAPVAAWEFLNYLYFEDNEDARKYAHSNYYVPIYKPLREAVRNQSDEVAQRFFFDEADYAYAVPIDKRPLWADDGIRKIYESIWTSPSNEIPQRLHELAMYLDNKADQ
jgi:multiple sugar transport system substrate-binding protein